MKEYTTVNIRISTYAVLKNRASRKNKPIYDELDEVILSAEETDVNEKLKFKNKVNKGLAPFRKELSKIKASDLIDLDEYAYCD
jgi:hypothetical protein